MATSQALHRLDVIDSLIGEEPIHCARSVGPHLGPDSLLERSEHLRHEREIFRRGGRNISMIVGSPHINAEYTLVFDPAHLSRLEVPA